jgi:hypothetical protein
MSNLGLCYLATPYTLTADIERAFHQAACIAANLSKSGLTVFSPIAHSHSLAKCAGLDHRDPAVYEALNQKMLELSQILIVVRMEGWQRSDGVRKEVAFFEAAHKPIFDCDPITLVMTRRKSQNRGHVEILEADHGITNR